MTASQERLIRDYLDRLGRALAAAPEDRRHEVIVEIESHIREEIAQLDHEPGDHKVLEILDRLGEPEAIAAETYEARPTDVPLHQPTQVPSRSRTLEVFALLFLSIGGFVLPILGWVVGLILLWISERWSTAEKVLGTFIPLALAGTLYGTFFFAAGEVCTGGEIIELGPGGRTKRVSEPIICESSGLEPWMTSVVFLTLALAAIGGTFYLAWRLSHPRPV